MVNETNDGRAKCGASIVGDIRLADNRLDHLLTSVASTLLLASIFGRYGSWQRDPHSTGKS